MGSVSSQWITALVVDAEFSIEWCPLKDVVTRQLSAAVKNWSAEYLTDIVEEHFPHVVEHLRNALVDFDSDGIPRPFELDQEDPPYARQLGNLHPALLRKLRRIDPFKLEDVCSTILSKFGAESKTTQRTNDDGVDFYALNFDFVRDGFATPQSSRAAIIGQTKRYKETNLVTETEVRAFVGGAMKVKNDLVKNGQILPLSPVAFAFWTTSDFDRNAKRYAKDMGLWFMSGRALAHYVFRLGMQAEIEALPDHVL